MDKRKLDGIFFRVKRNDKWQNICFSDLTEIEMHDVLEGRSEEWLKSLAIHLGESLRKLGDLCNVYVGDNEDGTD